MKEIIITKENKNQRLDKFIKRQLPECSTSFIYKQLRKKNIVLNDKKATGDIMVSEGDSVKFYFSDETYNKFSGSSQSDVYFSYLKEIKSKINIIFEDDDLIIINKPVGILSQKSVDSDISINEMALSYMINSNQLDEATFRTFHPSVINRLDRNTSGIVIFAKNLNSTQLYSKLLKERDMKKIYHAVVFGEIEQKMSLNGYLLKDDSTNKVEIYSEHTEGAKPIVTEYWPIKKLNDELTLLGIHLVTGRSHQIRAHLASIGHPILGDSKYGLSALNSKYKVKHQLLHAYSIEFADGRKFIAKESSDFNVNI